MQTLYDQIDREVVDAFISETLQGIGELATHHTIDEVYIDDLQVTSLTDSLIGFKVKGSLGVELQWGSGSDRRKGEAAVMRESLRFEVTMSAPVEDLTTFRDVEHSVDIREWYGEAWSGVWLGRHKHIDEHMLEPDRVMTALDDGAFENG
jgi:hypothetical protein